MAQSTPQLVAEIVHSSDVPLTLAEIRERIQMRQPVPSPRADYTLRSAIGANKLIASLGGRPAHYTWWPNHLDGNWFRQPLAHMDLSTGRLPINDEVWSALWPEFLAYGSRPADITLELAGGLTVVTQIDHLEPHKPVWGFAGDQDLAAWCRSLGATPEDHLLFHVLDARQRRHQVVLEPAARRDQASIAARDRQISERAVEVLRAARDPLSLHYDLVPRLVARGAFQEFPAPSPLAGLLRSDLRFVVGALHGVALTERLVAQEEPYWPADQDPFAAPRPTGNRGAPADASERQAWGEYLFDWGMEYRWGGDDLMAEACYRAALQVDPGHADAWVHVGNIRFDEDLVEAALSDYECGERAALERTIGTPRTYKGIFWGDLVSRPYMRALHGQGLCLWRLGRPDEARKVFRKMLRLNSNDNQGARFLVRDLDEGLSWEESVARDEAEHPGGRI